MQGNECLHYHETISTACKSLVNLVNFIPIKSGRVPRPYGLRTAWACILQFTMPIGAKKLTKAQRAERAEKVVSVLRSFSSYTGEFADGSWYNVLSVFGYNAMSDTVTVAMPYVSEVLRRRHSKQDKPQEMDFVQLTEEEIQRMQAKMCAREMSNI